MPQNTGLGGFGVKKDVFLLKKVEQKLDRAGQMS